ncbi:unnamed protein product [Paramecium sonneborni]|uniref:Uncharacterized protein n=1 Tax=Paramecium sonneborni TaxID=65129 RepID=A0A8S1Q4G4_9CILI|nr:unnamed protein product [Paramecium sonneborni]
MKSIFIAIILTAVIASTCKIFQEHSFHQQKYFRDEEIPINLQCSNNIKFNKEVTLHQKACSTQHGNQELITLFYKLLTIQF